MISHNIKNTVCNVTESIVLGKCDERDLHFYWDAKKLWLRILLQDGGIETIIIYVNKRINRPLLFKVPLSFQNFNNFSNRKLGRKENFDIPRDS